MPGWGDAVRIACVGGGPSGLYFALLMRLGGPGHEVTVFERGVPGATGGWGVDDLLEQLYRADAVSAREIERASFRWDGQVVEVRGTSVLPHLPPRLYYQLHRASQVPVLRGLGRRKDMRQIAGLVKSGNDYRHLRLTRA